MRGSAIVVVVLLGGCALTPNELATQGEVMLEHQSSRQTRAALQCAAEQIADTHGLLTTQLRESAVYAYWQGALWAIVQATPATGGTRLQVRAQPGMIVATRDEVFGNLKRC